MKLRTHRRQRHVLMAKVVRWHHLFTEWEERQIAYEDALASLDEYDDYYGRLNCTHCGGEGYCQVDDPLWNDCDEHGYGPCRYCDGTGDRAHQTVF